MRNRKKIEFIESAIQDLVQSNHHHLDVDRRILTDLLSQLESLKEEEEEDENVKDSEAAAAAAEMGSIKGACSCSKGSDNDIVVVKEELKKMEAQNRKTHRLLSGLILVIVTWQIAEVSLLFKLKGWLSNPLKSLGDAVTGVLNPDHDDKHKHDLLPLPININQPK